MNLKPPHSKKQVRSLLGVLNYYRKFIPKFSSLSAPISNLKKSGQPDKIHWTLDCQTALDKILLALNSDPILILPNFSQKFNLRTDASDTGLGVCLLQEVDGLMHPVTYIGRKLLPREKRYAIIERECLAIVWAVEKLSCYLLADAFYIETDSKPLLFLKERRSVSARLFRWALALQSYNFEIRYIPKPANCIADLLSRD
ncbi:Pol polyprotein [Elysia marginata]|uniref:Pol polyprotein n=1 Tax=Elysia marginata TaxID=1093978 RepID=A0AAV4HVX7_9GAST|nr:Pol polyprotein [Elysia marginata]